jgi:photosystem II stability/assembly factor-like uncharacterized protein
MSMLRILVILFLVHTSFAGEWNWQHPLPQGNTLWGIAFTGERYGFAVGDFGTILSTYDTGTTWQLQYEAITDNFRDLSVFDSSTAWIVGDNGMILHTSNGGFTWIEQESGSSSGLNAVFFLNSLAGWASGNNKTILHTTDGGTSWVKQTLPMIPNSTSINSICFVSGSEGWATGSGGIILHTTDGGTLWATQHTTGTTGLRIRFISATSGIVVGEGGSIFATTNSGTGWTQVPSGTTYGLNDVHYVSETECWIAGDNGTLLHSTNAGASWSNASLSTYASLSGISHSSAGLTVVGENGVFARKNGILPWTFVNSGDNRSVNWISFSDDLHGFGVGQYGLILHTTDGGSSWTDSPNGITLDSFYGSAMSDSNHLWLVGDLGVLLHTSDGGLTWAQQSTYTTNTLLSISFVDGMHGWAVGDLGEYLHTTNGGQNWIRQSIGTGTLLFGVEFKDLQNGWIVGDNNLILHTTNGGGTWNPQSSPVAAAIFSTHFVDLQNGYCAGSGGTILRTSDGGNSWSLTSSGTTRTVYVVAGTSTQSLWAVGDSGLILHSTDGGSHWSEEFAKTGFDLFGLHVAHDSLAWAAGDNGTILRQGSILPNEPPAVRVIRPNGGEVFASGNTEQIIWSATSVNRVAIDYSPDGGMSWLVVAADLPPSPGIYPWSVPTSATGSGLVRVRDSAQPAVFDLSDGPFTIAGLTISVAESWNLVSIPAIPESLIPDSIFPGAASGVYTFEESYIHSESLTTGKGYWVKYDHAATLAVRGTPVVRDTVNLRSRWNLIGTICNTISASAAMTAPPGILTTEFYAYDPGEGYRVADSLFPGRGYWVKSASEGALFLSSDPLAGATKPVATRIPGNATAVSVSDALGHNWMLYVLDSTSATTTLDQYELPPLPPDGPGDVRFSSNRSAEVLKETGDIVTIDLREQHFPVTIEIDNRIITDGRLIISAIHPDGKRTRLRPDPTGLFIVQDNDVAHLALERQRESGMPQQFSLGRNYPNPFNPSTSFPFALPCNSRVVIEIVNILGQRVKRLIDEEMDAGNHITTWDARDDEDREVGSGMYFVRFTARSEQAETYTSVGKLILMR